MNFFGGGEQKPAGPDPMFVAVTEMEMYNDLFGKMREVCFSKCLSRKHRDDNLALGEMTCTDRCVSKYMEAHEKVGVILQEANAAAEQQQQQQMAMQQRYG